ncbi:L,D-transpeptidase [Streptomyces sp. MUM 203J]|uniref:L,D-transpeptidase n=1 Tax=Streptomyces sp. MUM 203J TaxID=2791990 RepID=UPI001F049182|nr:L,D-transpeptidase [Streptomyces sp. MUM 203J]MCH0542396.1 L,D-transpeptidase [Streptomyces sp. MUM 203J]
MARSSSGFVAGLTAAALATVGFLAYQASATAPETLRGGTHGASSSSPSPSPSPSAGTSGTGPAPGSSAPAEPSGSAELPADSGSGERVVYGLKDRRVWLVDADGEVVRTFAVMPSTVHPAPGSYSVTSRSGAVTGSDGAQVEHVVRFTTVGGVTVGFSAAVDGSTPSPDPSRRTGGVRMTREDGGELWKFAQVNSKVVVVP